MNLMGFLYGKKARMFMHELWCLLISAQESVSGIPASFIEEKKQEILEKQVRPVLQHVTEKFSYFVKKDNSIDFVCIQNH